MKDCNHPKLQKLKKYSSMTVKCPDCKRDIFFLADSVRELMKNLYKTSPKDNPIDAKSYEIGSIDGVPIFISKGVDEK